jgi:hypothetical protein
MSALAALRKLLMNSAQDRRLSEELAEQLARSKTYSTAEPMLTTESGRVVGPQVPESVVQGVRETPVVVRRGSLRDLEKKGRLNTVHDVTKDVKRRELEQRLFGAHGQVYGALNQDPLAVARKGFIYDPEVGLLPEDVLAPYGQYAIGLKPSVRPHSTMTFGDSLDASRLNDHPAYVLSGSDNPAHPRSAIGELAQRYGAASKLAASLIDDTGKEAYNINFRALARKHGLDVPKKGEFSVGEFFDAVRRSQGLKDSYAKALATKFGIDHDTFVPLTLARPLDDVGLFPMLRTEKNLMGTEADALNEILGRRELKRGYTLEDMPRKDQYFEVQVHKPVTLEDISAIYDLSFKPSEKTRKTVESLGLKYEPRGPGLYDELLRRGMPKTIGDMMRKSLDAGYELSPAMRRLMTEDREEPVKFYTKGYQRGGLAQMKECARG